MKKTISDRKKLQNIVDSLGIFFQKVTDLKSEKYEDLKAIDYRPMLIKIGFKEEDIIQKALATLTIIDIQEQELAFEDLLSIHPRNKFLLFQRAYNEGKKKQFLKARRYYEDLLKLYHDFAEAHCNLAILLTDQFREYEKAKEHYEIALNLNPDSVEAHNSYAYLLSNYFDGCEDLAIYHYETAIKRNAGYATAHLHLSRLYKKLGKAELAEQYSNNAKAINPSEVVVYNYFTFEGYRIFCDDKIKMNPHEVYAHYNAAVHLEEDYDDYIGAREHYEKAIELNPNHANAHNNYAYLLEDKFSEYMLARKHYEIAIRINPNFHLAIENLSKLVKRIFPD